MPKGRKKIERTICIEPEKLTCGCMWPIKLDPSVWPTLQKVILYPDELQALAYKDLENLTMQEAATKMDISKTVFAGIYTSARKKQTDALINGKILTVQCAYPTPFYPLNYFHVTPYWYKFYRKHQKRCCSCRLLCWPMWSMPNAW